MKRQAIVVGLGQFGMAVAKALSDKNVEVFAVDIDDSKVQAAAHFVAEAATLDAMNEEALAQTAPDRRDLCLCAIGDEAKDASIICTALLCQLGAKRVVARANDGLHARILKLVGATAIVNPEREFGERFANRLLHDDIQGDMPLGLGLWVTQLTCPTAFVGKQLRDLQLPTRFGLTLVALRRVGSTEVVMPSADLVTKEGDVLILVAREGAVTGMMERL